MKALIVEDEHFAAEKLIQMIHQYDPSIEILDQLDTVEDAVGWFSTQSAPDLLFLDIHLADGSSFEIFEQVKVNCPIIFTTAFDQYALQAFKTKSIDYLLKPIKFPELQAAMDKFKEMFGQQPNRDMRQEIAALANLLEAKQQSYKSRFLVKAGNLIKTIPITEIAYFTFEDKLTFLVTKYARRYPVKFTLDEIEAMVDPHQFNRANRQFVISIDSIKKIHPWFKGRLKLELEPPQEADLVVSADKTKGFKEWLDR